MHPRPPCNGDTVLQHACHRRRSVVDFRSRDWRALASAICSTSASATAAPAAATCTAVRPHKHSQATLQAVAPVLPARAPWSVAIDLLHAAQPRGPQTACPALSSTPLARTYLTRRARTSAGWCVWACAARRVRVARASSDKQRRKERSASRQPRQPPCMSVAPVPTGALRRPADCGGGMARFEAEVRAGGRGERGRDGAAMRGGCGVRKGPTGRSGVTCASRVRARARGKGQGQTAPVGWGTRPHTRCLARSGAGRTQATLAVAAIRGGAALNACRRAAGSSSPRGAQARPSDLQARACVPRGRTASAWLKWRAAGRGRGAAAPPRERDVCLPRPGAAATVDLV